MNPTYGLLESPLALAKTFVSLYKPILLLLFHKHKPISKIIIIQNG